MENWKVIKDFPNYEVSDLGNVRSNTTKSKGKLLAKRYNKKGYSTCFITNDLGDKSFVVHRLVAEAFIPRIEGCDQVDHINQNKKDNNVNNLRWVTQEQNQHNITNANITNKNGNRNISERPNGTYRVRIERYGQKHSQDFKTLEEAIAARDEYLATLTEQ